MEVHRICELSPGAPVWVWIVRVGKGRWWPGSVLSIAARKPFPIINTRFECRSVGKNGIDGPVFVGISTTRMRYLELRDAHLKGNDRPNFAPSAIFAKPEQTNVELNDLQPVDAMNSDAGVPVASAIKKPRSRKKTKTSNRTKNVAAIAAQS
ncbi:MAG: hypothetical protein ABSB13_00435 [Candidatus Binatus sp.]|jgi:hypothetical protein|uniref:hypothetical protein n=1 Tax=Candidatus Binatus sp. TaxID=2811406 RepID=UPI003D0FED1B